MKETYHWVDQIVISVTLLHELFWQDAAQILAHLNQFVHIDLWRCVNDRRKSRVHIFWRSTLTTPS